MDVGKRQCQGSPTIFCILYLATLQHKASEGLEKGFDPHFIKKSEYKKMQKGT